MRSPCLALMLALLLVPPAEADTWYESYHKAEEALGRKSWSAAVQHLNAALEQQPSSSANIRTYGMRVIEYYPYLKLGIAYYHLGQADAALQAFETEERQAEIGKSSAGFALLRSYRDRIQRSQAEEGADRQRRVQSVLAENLALARRLEEQGRLEDALSALAKVLAVSPDHAEAQQANRRLLASLAAQAAAAEQQRQKNEEERRARLLQQAQDRPRAEIRAGQDEAERQRILARGLARAAELEGAGELAQSLAELQAVLSLDPRNSAARALQQRVLRAQVAAEESDTKAMTVRELLTEAEALLATGAYEQALRRANRVLALEPANEAALRQITRAHARLSDALLTPDRLPPTIRIKDSSLTGVVRSPQLVLTGTVYDSTPVKIQLLDANRPVGQPTVEGRELQGVWITDFRWQQRIPAGLSKIVVVAVDEAGNRAAVQYQVEYVVPFVRSWWFPGSIAAGLASVAAALVAVKARRRRKLLRGRFNPYIAGAPILEQARFFGRQQLLDYVLRRISNNSLMLYGERRIGKTSLQHQLKRFLTNLDDPEHEFFPVYIDLQGTPQEKFFGTLAAEIFHELAPKLGGIQSLSPPGQDEYGYSDLVKDLQRILKALKDRTAKKVKLVLLIDEVDELNEYDPRVNQRLRSLFMRTFADSLVAVVSGVAIKKQWEREGSPWYNFFQEIEVKPLDREEARSLIEAPLRGMFALEDGVADEIIRRTGGKPYLIQRLCSGLVDRMHEGRRRKITVNDVEAACQTEGL